VQVVGRGTKVFAHEAVRGTWRVLEGPEDVLALMDGDAGAEGVVALVREAGATFLAPIYHELTAVVCTNGTPSSHIGIVSREFHVPCVMGATFDDHDEPSDGDEVEVDCGGDGDEGVVRA
jgi:signal transduction protein with GAF and PtsI domain